MSIFRKTRECYETQTNAVVLACTGEGAHGTRTGHGNDEIQSDQHETFHVIGFPISVPKVINGSSASERFEYALEKKVDEQHRNEKGDGLRVMFKLGTRNRTENKGAVHTSKSSKKRVSSCPELCSHGQVSRRKLLL